MFKKKKKDVVYICNRILPSHKIEWNNAICSNMDGPGDDYTKWSKSDRERHHIIITYMWNLKKWTYLQNRNRVTDVENKLMVTSGGRWGRDKLRDWDWHIHTTVHKVDN